MKLEIYIQSQEIFCILHRINKHYKHKQYENKQQFNHINNRII